MHKFMSLRKGRNKGLWDGSRTKVLLQKHGDWSSDPHQVHKSQGQLCASANPTLRGETKTGDLRRPLTSQFSQMDELWVEQETLTPKTPHTHAYACARKEMKIQKQCLNLRDTKALAFCRIYHVSFHCSRQAEHSLPSSKRKPLTEGPLKGWLSSL